jgi:hypothetical protein
MGLCFENSASEKSLINCGSVPKYRHVAGFPDGLSMLGAIVAFRFLF